MYAGPKQSGWNFASTSTLRTADFGRLDWPVEGDILYPFGRYISPSNTTLRWNGIGIAAPGPALDTFFLPLL